MSVQDERDEKKYRPGIFDDLMQQIEKINALASLVSPEAFKGGELSAISNFFALLSSEAKVARQLLHEFRKDCNDPRDAYKARWLQAAQEEAEYQEQLAILEKVIAQLTRRIKELESR